MADLENQFEADANVRLNHFRRRTELNWNKWIRQFHRWLAIAFTLLVLANFVCLAIKAPEQVAMVVGMITLIPLFLLLFTGLYMFFLPYFRKPTNAPAE